MPRPSPQSPASAEKFGLRFRLLMSYHNLTLKDIAAATRSAVSTVGTWRNGRVPSSKKAVELLAEIFHVSVEYLLGGPPPSQPPQNGIADEMSAEAVAGRVLMELDLLVWALECAGPKPGLEDEGGGGGEGASMESAGLEAGKKPAHGNATKGGAGKVTVRRRQVEKYVKTYLDKAERAPGGLAHAWVQLRREFPLDLYERLR